MPVNLSPWAEVLLVLVEVGFLFRVLTRPHREPASRLAWLIVIIAVPVLGMIAYLMLGEIRISGRRRSRGREIEAACGQLHAQLAGRSLRRIAPAAATPA